MISLDVSLHARGDSPRFETVWLRGEPYQSIVPNQEDRQAAFGISFEKVAERLEKLSRFFLEPDGSFVWVGDGGWQLDGVILDRDERVTRLEVKGTCPAETLESLFAVLGWPQTKIVFQLTRAGVFLEEGEFRRLVRWRHEPSDRRD